MPLRQDVAASVLSIEIAFDYLIFVESQGQNCRFVFLELTSCMISLDLTGPLSGPARRRWTSLRPRQTLLDPSQTQSDHIFEIIC